MCFVFRVINSCSSGSCCCGQEEGGGGVCSHSVCDREVGRLSGDIPETIVLVQRESVKKTSGHLKEVMEDHDFAKLSSILIPDPHGIFSCTKSGKKLVWNRITA